MERCQLYGRPLRSCAHVFVYRQRPIIEEPASRQDLEHGEPEEGRLQRHHRDPSCLEAKVRICTGE